ncbi:bifunctional glycosyltransferase family 2/GtrA family protein [Arsenicicoccus piscis]|uniref:bifunctional glycosyltransferase family 2/GtrA family protein n=1 Tax=Arsenicicoccus piscis TaxID=673954 RepID=UPI001F4C8BE1|nr:bifunctional glycosyltransferase family 2/GtrA family protein [Arsenicicoccus piscis]MCH8626503.1 bifunctional glycosyltransferase family 2/GtrA family protein [Arsenicicoccus piscis]
MTTPTPSPVVLDVVIPVYNEQVTLRACVRRLVDHLQVHFAYPFQVTIADNASTDETWAVARELEATLPTVRAVHLDAKGRGRALKSVWLASPATVLAYMDVDLSTDLDALLPLVAALMSGHSDVAIGTRLARQSRVERGAKRELISRSYNLLLRAGLGAEFSDAQCGFKAIRADVARELLPLVEDTSWFFDTELLVLAERCGLRIHEVPVDWYDDPDSRVDIVRTAADDLAGIRRVRRSLRQSTTRDELTRINRAMGRRRPGARLGTQLARFATIGVGSTVLHLGLFAALRLPLGSAMLANLVALLVATIANTAANRAWTFEVRGAQDRLKHQLQGLTIFGITWAATSLGLLALHALAPTAPVAVETAVVAVMNVVSTLVRFVALRAWMGGEQTDAGYFVIDAADQPRTEPGPVSEPTTRLALVQE